MTLLKELNDAIAYIENSLCGDPDPNKAAAIACVSTDTFLRFFSYITGMTLTDYIRKRRLTLAAQDLTDADDGVADLAVKYGYDSASAFSRAFAKQHGITPSAYRKNGGSLRIVPPVSFHICIKGAEEMDFRMIELNETKLYGISRKDEGYRNREELRHLMWSEEEENIPCRICAGRWNQPGCTSFDGEWYGIWNDGRYMIAREEGDAADPPSLETVVLPAGRYAAFRTKPGGAAWEEFPRLFELIFQIWLPSSGYRVKSGMIVEILHLRTDHDLRKKNRYYEVWLPITE
ncbi:MAG: AraC family transcriptional regulator [Clostridia bacterium]|nr:AraC family transcriptional regulator [Clostridia bacterium]